MKSSKFTSTPLFPRQALVALLLPLIAELKRLPPPVTNKPASVPLADEPKVSAKPKPPPIEVIEKTGSINIGDNCFFNRDCSFFTEFRI